VEKIATVGGAYSYNDTGLECNNLSLPRASLYANGKSFYSNTSEAVTNTSDTFESDNTYATASTITVNGRHRRTFSVNGDQDWVKFSTIAGQVYTITTSNLGAVMTQN